ncbi:nucleotidyltransferase domain-containing protein [Candidatus Collierbacteria bacterium]|nr:nucleotidyltransferase domain-containing protein [Candidatus Collierbacteria bacterium]
MTNKTFQSHLDKIVATIAKKYQPEKIILFGSAASGLIHEDSDADLAIIKKTKKNIYDRIGEVSDMVEHDIALDIIVYTPEEFETMKNDKYGYFVRDEIIEKGKIIYEAN